MVEATASSYAKNAICAKINFIVFNMNVSVHTRLDRLNKSIAGEGKDIKTDSIWPERERGWLPGLIEL